MELKEMRTFLAVANSESMTTAAEELHTSQPNVSKQIKSLERELGHELFERRNFGLSLTDEGRLFYERASDLVDMADKVQAEFLELDNVTGGELYFGLAESLQIKYLARILRQLKVSCPDLHYQVESGTTAQVLNRVESGILDFAVLAELPDAKRYQSIEFPEADRWGLVFRSDDPLAAHESLTVEQLIGIPLFCARQSWVNDIPRWACKKMRRLTLEATIGLPYNGTVFAREGLGYLLTFEHLANVGSDSGLVFRPLEPPLLTCLYLVWRKGSALSPIAEKFLDLVRESWL